MASASYQSKIDLTKPYRVDRTAAVWTQNKTTNPLIDQQGVNVAHSGIRMSPDIYWAYPSGS